MDESRRWSHETVLLGVVVTAVVAAVVTAFVTVVRVHSDPQELTIGTAVVGTALFVGAIALPALLFSKWDEAEPDP
ncbi:hypothetical protein [Halopiger goleimassiliensis]|uniref:hypothetical protein n=1 Tax=Halopiger goleimassiliensis TaxID=1293048 RepID=UPI0006775EEF|nr:hypothetical protein [Halopiger goleimassiliensis]